MSDKKEDEPDKGEAGVYKVETVPPPAGEDDAYSAPTRVGPMGAAFVHDLMKDAEQRSSELARKEQAKAKAPEPSPASKRPVEEPSPSSKAPVSAGGTPLPRIYEEEEEEDAATKLSPKAKPPAIPQRPKTLQVSDAPAAGSPPPANVPPPPADMLKQFAPDLAPTSAPPSSSPTSSPGSAPLSLPRSMPPASSPLPPSTPEPTPISVEPARAEPHTGRRIAFALLVLVLAAIAALLWSKHLRGAPLF